AVPARLVDAGALQEILVVRTADDRGVDRRPRFERDALDRREAAAGLRLRDLAHHVLLHLALAPDELALRDLLDRAPLAHEHRVVRFLHEGPVAAVANAEARADLGPRFIGATELALRLHVENGVEERLLVVLRIEAREVELDLRLWLWLVVRLLLLLLVIVLL